MNETEELAEHIKGQPLSLIADSNTFVWVRSHHPEILGENPELGGGNFLMTLGLFATIGYLAKVNAILNNKDIAITSEQESQAKELLKKIFKEIPELRSIVHSKREGEINEKEAFALLLQHPGFNLGLSIDEIVDVWDGLRNRLTHRIAPKLSYQVNVRMGGKSYKQAKEEADTFVPFQKMADGRVFCNIDSLITKVDRLRKNMARKVLEGTYRIEEINAALNWIKRD